MGGVAVGHEGGERAEGLHLVHQTGGIRIIADQQHRRQECLFGIGIHQRHLRGIAMDQPRLCP